MNLFVIVFIICLTASTMLSGYNQSQERIATLMKQPCAIEHGNTK